MSEETRRRGAEMLEQVYGGRVKIEPTSPRRTATLEHVFGEVWARPALPMRDRRLLVIGVLAVFGMPEQLELQFTTALERGELTAEQIDEINLQLAYYVGWPRSGTVSAAADRALGVASNQVVQRAAGTPPS
jgi:alkylhydroperoxidase/carboxymuconolactone decarboxylase family protein YurZ